MAYLDKAKAYKAEKAKEFLKSLEGPEANILKEWILEKDSYAKELQDKISEMSEVFAGIAKFTFKGPIRMGN